MIRAVGIVRTGNRDWGMGDRGQAKIMQAQSLAPITTRLILKQTSLLLELKEIDGIRYYPDTAPNGANKDPKFCFRSLSLSKVSFWE